MSVSIVDLVHCSQGNVGFSLETWDVGLSKLWGDELEELITEDLYYSGGVGIRYMLNTDQKINFRIDAAVGNGDNEGIYVGIQEAL